MSRSAPTTSDLQLGSLQVSLVQQLIIIIMVMMIKEIMIMVKQGCISCGTCSYPKLTEDHVLTSAYVKIFRTVTRNVVNKSV